MNLRKNKGISKILLPIVIVILAILTCVVIYVTNTSKNQESEIHNSSNELVKTESSNNIEAVIQQNNNQTNELSLSNEVEVVEGINYIDTYTQRRNIKLPQIKNGGERAKELNKQMLSEVLKHTYGMLEELQDNKLNVTYKYETNNNIITIKINEKWDDWPASGDGNFNYEYTYDTSTDKYISNKIDVIEGVNYIDSYTQRRNIKLPQVINGGYKASELNKKMLSDILKHSYGMLEELENNRLNITYTYDIKDNIITIKINEKWDDWPASGDGNFNYEYTYNTTTDTYTYKDDKDDNVN